MSIFGISQGFGNIVGDVKDLFNIGQGGDFSLTNPNIAKAVCEIDDDLWNENPGYGFCVSKKDDPLNPISDFAEFKFQINPTAIRQDEDFSISPRATQTGVIVEHEGFVFKKMTISGTGGLQPKRGIGGVTETGQVQLGAGHSGYHEFGTLINYIRAYAQYKTDPNNTDVRLVFKNFKDNEYWIVEPLRFSKNRDASKPHLHFYEISLLITGKAVREPSAFETFFNNIKDALDTYILEPLNDIQQIIEDGTNLILQVENEAESIILTPLREIQDTLTAINTGKNIVSDLPREFYESYQDRVIGVGNSLSDLFGQNNSGYDTFYGRTAVIVGTSPQILTSQQVELMQAFIDLENVINRILATNQLFEEPTTNKNTIYEDYYNGTVSIPKPTATIECIVSRGDTIERIAARFLGTSDRCLEIITLNNLEPPYIDQTGTSDNYRIKKPGDKILIPTFTSLQEVNPNKIDARVSSLTSGLSAMEKFFGVDFKLSKDFDLVFNNRGDFEYSYGLGNAVQAISIKMNLEKGGLPVNPELGIDAGIGEKTKRSAGDIKQDIRTTITQDPRFANIVALSVKREGSKLSMSLNVQPTNVSQPIPVRIALG